MSNMFCFQCQQTAGNKACVNTGVCGKQPSTSNLQDELICELIRLAEAAGYLVVSFQRYFPIARTDKTIRLSGLQRIISQLL